MKCTRLLLVMLGVLIATGCSNYTNRSLLIKSALMNGNYASALESVEGIDKSRSELLYYYEKGLVLHYQDAFVESNAAFEQAEIVLDDLYTKSLTREAAALAISDNVAKYRGDAHEAILIHYYKIMNYLHMGDVDGATVECRRVNGKLERVRDAEGDYLENDPFLQYLTAMVYEEAGEYEDAEVSYRVAVATFEELAERNGVEPPPSLFCDAARNARGAGDRELARSYERADSCATIAGRMGTVNVFLECGYVDHKVESSIELPILKTDDQSKKDNFALELSHRRGRHYRKEKIDYWLKVSLPGLVTEPTAFSYAIITATMTGEKNVSTETSQVENVSALSRQAFDEKSGKIFVRAIVRALGKYAAKQKADNKGAGFGVLVNILGVVTESADTRSWSTLPSRILMSRLQLAPGTYDIEVQLMTGAGSVHDQFVIPDVTVTDAGTQFINYRVY